MGNFKNLLVYQKAFALAVAIHEVSKSFPDHERFSLTDQLRRSSRSVCANISEAENRKRYRDYFIAKLHDSITENGETEVWLDFSLHFQYLTLPNHATLIEQNGEVSRMLRYMINNPDKFI